MNRPEFFNNNQFEINLSPEQTAKIMEKVIDINGKGTAFTVIGGINHSSSFEAVAESEDLVKIYQQKNDLNKRYQAKEVAYPEFQKQEQLLVQKKKELFERPYNEAWLNLKEFLRGVLNHGLIGQTKTNPEMRKQYFPEGKMTAERRKLLYGDIVKQKGVVSPVVYGNIIGRSDSTTLGVVDNIENSYWNKHSDFSISVIIDREKFEEKDPAHRAKDKSILSDKWTYWADDPSVSNTVELMKEKFPGIQLGDERYSGKGSNNSGGKAFTDDGLPSPDQEHGFAFFPRIPKRFIKGIVIKMESAADTPKVQGIIDLVQQACNADPNLLVPIYSTNGDLLWPEKKTHQEIIHLIKEKKVPKKSE